MLVRCQADEQRRSQQFFLKKNLRFRIVVKTYLLCPDVRLRLEVRLARLASRSPVTILAGSAPAPPPPPAAEWPLVAPPPPAPPPPADCGWRMSPKKSAPTAGKGR